ncbi:MAG TPA: hypothetical protein VKX39_15725 [Bryobacteraceae bacterium]|jgi:hypothetical protein|nr:hypothetical protein [Bryobacteraceae bacterium]
MTTQSFENLDFSILVEQDNHLAYLQQWDDGVWSEPHRFTLPLSPEKLARTPILAQALKSFRRDPQIQELRQALTHGAWSDDTAEKAGPLARFWAAIQASFRQRARQIG